MYFPIKYTVGNKKEKERRNRNGYSSGHHQPVEH
jgi:hypothetical protein